MTTAKSSSQTD